MTTTFHSHWRDVPEGTLALAEFLASRDRLPGHLQAARQRTALDTLQARRDRLGKPLIVRSAYRSPEHTIYACVDDWRAGPNTTTGWRYPPPPCC